MVQDVPSWVITSIVGILSGGTGVLGTLTLVRSEIQKLRSGMDGVVDRLDRVEQKQDLARGEGTFANQSSLFVRKADCKTYCRGHICSEIRRVEAKVAANTALAGDFDRFARWYLSVKEGKSLAEINKILAGSGKE